MSTVAKAVVILEVFGIERSELGLSEIGRLAGYDKATCYRLLTSLTQSGLVERNIQTRLYRLGPAVVRLARIRESHFPLTDSAKGPIVALSKLTGETAHFTEYDSGALTSLVVHESTKANRISVSVGDRLPLNATASGLAFLAFGPAKLCETYLNTDLNRYTDHTITSQIGLREEIARTRSRGYSIGNQGREDGVFSVGAPVLNHEQVAIGAVSVAAPVFRIDDEAIDRFAHAVMNTAQEISASLFGGLALNQKRAV